MGQGQEPVTVTEQNQVQEVKNAVTTTRTSMPTVSMNQSWQSYRNSVKKHLEMRKQLAQKQQSQSKTLNSNSKGSRLNNSTNLFYDESKGKSKTQPTGPGTHPLGIDDTNEFDYVFDEEEEEEDEYDFEGEEGDDVKQALRGVIDQSNFKGATGKGKGVGKKGKSNDPNDPLILAQKRHEFVQLQKILLHTHGFGKHGRLSTVFWRHLRHHITPYQYHRCRHRLSGLIRHQKQPRHDETGVFPHQRLIYNPITGENYSLDD